MKLKFTKMHGCGNDYVYIDCFNQSIDNVNKLAIRLSDRHFGIGGDGIILMLPSSVADCKMRMFNNDGSEGKMCGNGVRCVAKLLHDNNHLDGNPVSISIETLSGIKTLFPFYSNGKITDLKVDMGKAILNPCSIPINTNLINPCPNKIVNLPYSFDNYKHNITCVSMGNPHCVIFRKDIDNIDIEKEGPVFENDILFPQRVNTEFVEVIDNTHLKMRVWERGSGETMACGTGASAVCVAACENGICNKNQDITIQLKGGNLIINYTDSAVFITGEAVSVFTGEINV